MYKTNDGQIMTTLDAAIAHEKELFLIGGLTPLLTRVLGHTPTLPPDCDAAQITAGTVSGVLHDVELLEDLRKFFSKPPTAAKKVTRRRKAKARPTPTVDLQPTEVAPPTYLDVDELQLEALGSLAGQPIELPGDVEPTEDEGPPPPPPGV